MAKQIEEWLKANRLEILDTKFKDRGIMSTTQLLESNPAKVEEFRRHLKPIEIKRFDRALEKLRLVSQESEELFGDDILIHTEDSMSLHELLVQKSAEEKVLANIVVVLCNDKVGWNSIKGDVSIPVKKRLEGSKKWHVDRLRRVKSLIARKKSLGDGVGDKESAFSGSAADVADSARDRKTLTLNNRVVLHVPDKYSGRNKKILLQSERQVHSTPVVTPRVQTSVAVEPSTSVPAEHMSLEGRSADPAVVLVWDPSEEVSSNPSVDSRVDRETEPLLRKNEREKDKLKAQSTPSNSQSFSIFSCLGCILPGF